MANGNPLHTFEGIAVEIDSIKRSIAQLTESIGSLAQAFNDRGRTPWVVLIGFGTLIVTIMGGIGTLAYLPVKDSLLKTESRIDQQQARLDQIASAYVSRAENDRLRNEDKDRAQIVRQQIYDDLKQLTEAVNTISRTFVPRVEAEAIARLQEKLAGERAKNTELRLNRHSTIIDRLSIK